MTRISIDIKDLYNENLSNKTDSEGNKASKLLSSIISLVKKVKVNNLKEREIKNVITNLKWTERKIQKYNQQIDKNVLLITINNLLFYLSFGTFQLKYTTLKKDLENIENQYAYELKKGEQLLVDLADHHDFTDEKLQKLSEFLRDFDLAEKDIPLFAKVWPKLSKAIKEEPAIVEKFFKYVPVDLRTQLLLETDEKTLGVYYKDRSVIKDYALDSHLPQELESKLTPEIVELLRKLIDIQHKTAFLEVQNTPIIRHIIIKELTAHLDSIEVKPGQEHTLQALKALEGLSTFIPQENLLQILIFVRKNRDAIFNKMIGVQSKSRVNIRKVKRDVHHLPYDLVYHVDSGSFEVKAKQLAKGTYKVAYKQLSLTSPELEKQVVAKQEKSPKEVELLKLAKGCQHVIQFHYIDDYKSSKKGVERQAMVFPFYSLGELGEYLKKSSLSEKAKLQIAIDIIKGVMELHALGIIHRDIKPANIFLEKGIDKHGNEEIHAFIGDLGLGCMRVNDPDRNKLSGSPFYLPPEVFRSEPADFDADAWAVGVTLAQLFTGTSPIHTATNFYEIRKLQRDLADPVKNPSPADKTSANFVIWKLLTPDRATRMPLREALTLLENKLATLS